MNGGEERNTPYFQAAAVLPETHYRTAAAINAPARRRAEEFRLRVGHPMTVLIDGREHRTDGPEVTEGDLRTLLERASRSSAHTVLDRVRSGFVTIRGGHRIGLCGTAVMREGSIQSLDRLSSAAVRIAKPVEGLGGQAVSAMAQNGRLCSTLILAPPGAGKTTLLREMVLRLSDGVDTPARRVGLADERGEVAAVWEGKPQLGVGSHTDVMSGCPKAAGLSILLRGMSPEVLAADEITAEADVDAMTWAVGCGVTLLATAHGGSVDDLTRRPLYRKLMELGLFRRVLLLESRGGLRTLRCEVLP